MLINTAERYLNSYFRQALLDELAKINTVDLNLTGSQELGRLNRNEHSFRYRKLHSLWLFTLNSLEILVWKYLWALVSS